MTPWRPKLPPLRRISRKDSTVRTNHALPTEPFSSLEAYELSGGMSGLSNVRAASRSRTIEIIGESGIRGRGGAGFPTGRKWHSVSSATADDDEAFIVINAAEGEPGTFKDRALLRSNPYAVLEGALIACHCIPSRRVVVATKASYGPELAAIRRAVGELTGAGWLESPVGSPASAVGSITIDVVEGPDHYLYGEESALLEVIEGEEPLPRHLPPYEYGLFTTSPQMGWSAGSDLPESSPTLLRSNPAVVNNVETFAHVALVCRHGAAWYRSMGSDQTPGPTIVTITGDVNRPVVAEIGLGHRLEAVIDELAEGPTSGRSIKAVLSGVSNPVLTGDKLTAPITHEHLRAAGGGLGSAGFIVYGNDRNMIDVAYQVSRFLHVESCGQCNPCKTGTHDITAALEELVLDDLTSSDVVATIERRMQTVTDASRCYLPSQEQILIASILGRFPEDLAQRFVERGNPDIVLPKLIDIIDGRAVIDEAHSRKRSDWTYSSTPVRFSSAG